MFRNNTLRIAAIIMLLSTTAMPQTGLAASYLDTLPKGKKTSYSASLVDMTQAESGITTRTLDWRQPSVELYFDLPPSERTSAIVLNLSADPLTRVAPNAPLQVQFNNGKPVPVLSNGRGFEARLPLDAANSRDRRNVIRLSYPTPSGADCVSPAHGAWSVDLADSSLKISGRTKIRRMSLTEVTDTLKQPALSPKTVGLIARGPNGTDMQALAAQGISLRTPGVPNFSVTKQRTDFNVVMVKRNRLFEVTNDPMILNSAGPRIFVPRGRPTELIFTGDTDAEILQMLEIFATRSLPTTRRAISSLGEMNLQYPLIGSTPKIDGKARLLDLAVASTYPASGAQTYKFGVTDPAAMEGQILLRLSTTEELAENSRLRVTLNGKTLGAAKLDKKRKSVAFDIQRGTLNATSNILTLVPDMDASPAFVCPTGLVANTGFSIGDGSRININSTTTALVTELSQLTSTGGLFGQSESYIALPRQTQDYQASLRILGRMAKAAGQGLISADYTRKADFSNDKHLLIIGPSYMAKKHLTGAPKAFREAFSGQSSTGDNLLEARYGQTASLGSDDAALKYAAVESAPRRVNRGGIAALYATGNGRLTGVISAVPGSSFVQASQSLVKPAHWNSLQGGVARWTSSSVIMAQTAQSDAGIIKPFVETKSKFPSLDFSTLDNFNLNWPDIQWPEFELPEFDMPDFEMPQVGFPNLKWPSFGSANEMPPVQPLPQTVAASRTETLSKIKTTDLKTMSNVQEIVDLPDVAPRLKPTLIAIGRPNATLRGPIEFSIESPKDVSLFQDIQRETKAKWSAATRWVKTKADSVINSRALTKVNQATGRAKNRVEPAGQATLKDRLPGKGLVQLGNRKVSIYGLILMLAFGLVLLLMTLAKPSSRLGGRH